MCLRRKLIIERLRGHIIYYKIEGDYIYQKVFETKEAIKMTIHIREHVAGY